jgi:hypothetical protein
MLLSPPKKCETRVRFSLSGKRKRKRRLFPKPFHLLALNNSSPYLDASVPESLVISGLMPRDFVCVHEISWTRI